MTFLTLISRRYILILYASPIPVRIELSQDKERIVYYLQTTPSCITWTASLGFSIDTHRNDFRDFVATSEAQSVDTQNSCDYVWRASSDLRWRDEDGSLERKVHDQSRSFYMTINVYDVSRRDYP